MLASEKLLQMSRVQAKYWIGTVQEGHLESADVDLSACEEEDGTTGVFRGGVSSPNSLDVESSGGETSSEEDTDEAAGRGGLLHELRTVVHSSIRRGVESGVISYATFQLERGKEGTEHAQVYIQFAKKLRLSGVIKVLPGHWEISRGTPEQARDYCRKDDTRVRGPWEYGEFTNKGQGRRSELVAVKEAIDAGASEETIADNHFSSWVRYHKAFAKYRDLHTKPRNHKTKVILCYGEPGSGKSTYCHEEAPDAYWKQRSGWWCGYNKHKDVVLDDFKGWLPWSMLLHLLDRFPLMVENKGGQGTFVAERIFITSNFLPSEWYDMTKGFPIAALERRIDSIIHFKKTPLTGFFTSVTYSSMSSFTQAILPAY